MAAPGPQAGKSSAPGKLAVQTRLFKAKFTKLLRFSGPKDGLEYVQSGVPTQGQPFKRRKSEPNTCGSGLGKEGVETRVAGLLTASDATYGEKNMQWHGLYCMDTIQASYHVVTL